MSVAAKTNVPSLSAAFFLGPREGQCIDPVQLLQYLDNYANILAEETAKPGLDPTKTELARGQRLHCLMLIRDIKEELKNVTTR